jgi:MFS family permease
MAMPAVATLVGPALGVTLYVTAGELLPLLLALGLGLGAFATSIVIRLPQGSPQTGSVSERRPRGRVRWRGGSILEASAIPSTLMVTTFMAGHSVFLVFPPVYLSTINVPVDILAVYYPVYGLAMTVSQLLVGRASDRLGRATSVQLGCGLAIAGFSIAFVLHDLPGLVLASIAYATAMALVSPTLSALTIDRAPRGRLGAAMATYSLGYQLATGASSIVWGVVIAAVGFPWPFALAILLQVVTIAFSVRFVTTPRAVRV